METPQKIDEVYAKITDTFKFHGVTLVDVDIDSECPTFYINISRKAVKKTIDQVLNFAYWTLWTLTYGEYALDKMNDKINLNYRMTE